ncbi:MAG: DEAD/DEAH box helicase [Planctomycetaceae bacterium]
MSDNNAGEPYPAAVEPSPFEAFEMSTTVSTPEPVDASLVDPFQAVVEECRATLPVADAPQLCHQNAPSSNSTSDAGESVDSSLKSAPKEITFRDLPLLDAVQQAVQDAGYERPTPIQAEIIPHMLDGRDVLAQSQTGTGKTAAFALPILSRIEIGSRTPQVLVLTPTRELAIQVARSFSTYGSGLTNFAVAAIYGGQDYTIQFKQLRRGVEVVVGTPGRVIDHIKRGTLDLSGLKTLVLDEADEMLNMGFLDDVQFVLDQTPDGRQIALFSATLPIPIRNISKRYLHNPARITIQKKTMTADSIRQRALLVNTRDKVDVLKRLLEIERTDGVIVFTNTKDTSVRIAEQLNREGLSAVALNGDMPQKIRERTIEQLKAGHIDILVATDVAARGLDVTRISHVFNFDVPQDGESYIHRIGRTGRAGRAGEAVIFLTHAQRNRLRIIERATKQAIELIQPPTAAEINAVRIQRFTERISATAADQDLTMFQEMITKFAEESGTPLVTIAAALAQIGQQGRPFLMQDRPRRKPQNHRDQYGSASGTSQKTHRSPTGHSGNGKPGNGKPGTRTPGVRPLGLPESGKDRYRIEVGWKDGVKPGNIVGAIANEGGLSGEHIGPINISDSFSTVDLPEDMPQEVFETLQRTRVAGKPLQLSLTADDGQPSRFTQSPGKKLKRDKTRRPGGHRASGNAVGQSSRSTKRKKKKAGSKQNS